ncbi:hypothetical protein R7P75_04595 [Vibrio sp. 2175-1]|uniref:hypothetical protein n=1 Tax=Vibrio TaxID=662 RepID=UPI001CDC2CED|nr:MULTISPECIES: hypothetical protein [Vibrio]MCA2497797.1 hypothetical protein [Vibrio alginolyticus]MDW2217484.1 hypothetical protein [Vibrio sp. 2175-1]
MSSEPKLFEPISLDNTKSEHEKNLERGKTWMEHGLKPYEGEFPELDLESIWYCPECRELDRPLKLSPDRLSVSCSNPAYVSAEGPCEYSYSNAAGREKHQTFWSEGFELPLSRTQLIEGWIETKQQYIKCTKKRIKQSKQDIKNLEQEIVDLKAQLLEL